MVRRTCLLLVFALFVAFETFAQSSTCSYGQIPTCSDDQTVSSSGSAITVNSNGGVYPAFEYVVYGSPVSMSITVNGCGKAGTCEALDTYSIVANTFRAVTVTKSYAYYTVTPTWSGGTNVSVRVVTRISTAGPAGSGAGGSVSVSNWPANQAVTQPTGTNLHVVCDAGCSSSTAPSFGTAFPLVGTPVGGSDGTNFQAFQLDASKFLKVNLQTAIPAGTNVIGHIIVDSAPSTAVTGTFWQSTQPVSIATMPSTPVTGTFWQSTQPTSIADGSLTTLGTKADAKSTATDTTAVSGMAVLKEISAMEQAPASRAVTNAGTFAVQAALNAETTKVIGTVNIASAQSVGIAAGSAVIGHVIVDTAPSTAVTGTVTATQATGTNLHVVVDSAPTTAVTGTFWQGAQPVSGSVTATQATGTNLHMVCDSGCSSSTSPTFGAAFPSVGTPVGGSDGTNFQALQLDASKFLKVNLQTALPAGANVIGHVIVDSTPATAVTGTFWQATQPVSIASMPSTPVTGTFWQATQPVSLAALPSLAAGSAVIGHVIVDTAPSTAVTNVGTFAVQVTSTANPCMAPGATIQGAAGVTSGTSAVQIIGLSGTTKIYVCSITVTGVSGTTPTFSLKYGTGTACATGGVTLWGPFTSTALTAFVMPPNSVVTPAGQELCYLDGGTTPIQNYAITYVQQ